MEGGKALFTIVLIMGYHLSLVQKLCVPATRHQQQQRPSPIAYQNFAMLPGALLQQCHERGTSAHHLSHWHVAGPVSTKRLTIGPTSLSMCQSSFTHAVSQLHSTHFWRETYLKVPSSMITSGKVSKSLA